VAVARLLPCAYDASVKKLISAIETLRPDALLMTGQAARRAVVCVERFAHNLDDATAPDNDGALRRALRISRAAPEWLETKASVRTIASAIKEAGIRARASRDAGGFVCNHLYFGALQYLSEKRSAIPAVFVHLPVTPEQAPPGANEKRLTRTEASDALRAAAKAILDRAKDGEEA
jgi:pyroglutamyl-peptidase